MGDGDEPVSSVEKMGRQRENELAAERWRQALEHRSRWDISPAAWRPVVAMLCGAALIGVVVAVLLSSDRGSGGDGGGGGGGGDDLNRYTAIQACEGSVKKQLKAPATADFSDEHARRRGAREYDIAGYVDAENSFGAKLRSTWTGVAMTRDGGQTWRCLATVDE